MNPRIITMPLLAASLLVFVLPGFAGQEKEQGKMSDAKSEKMKKIMAVKRHLPIPPPAGLFGAYAFPNKGQGVVGINYVHFSFKGMKMGTDSVSGNTVTTTVANRFFGMQGMPPTVRLVPIKADADVIYPFANYALSSKLALVGVAPIVRKETTFRTYQGAMGTKVLGNSTVKATGLGDIKGGVLYRAYNDKMNHLLLIGALSAPTGDITERGNFLTPANTIQNARLPYGMQLGSGTWDAIVGASYWGKKKYFGWGLQYYATLPLEDENDEGYRWGNKHEATAWVSYLFMPQRLDISARIRAETQDSIHGIDPNIVSAGVGADPDNYGGDRVELSAGVNWSPFFGQNISLELAKPIYQDRNGVQLSHDYTLYASWRVGLF